MLAPLRRLINDSWDNFCRHQPLQTAAALSFYSLFSLAPLTIVVVAVAGLFFSDSVVQDVLISRIGDLIDQEAAALVATIIENTQNQERNVFSLIIGAVLIAIGATTAFAHLYGALNRIWNVETTGTDTIWQIAKGRLLSFAFLIVIGMLLVGSLLFSTGLATFNQFLSSRVAIEPVFWRRLDLAISYGLTTVLIAIIYKVLPDARVPWRDALLGAVTAALLFEGSKKLIGFYISQISPESTFGAAGSVVVFMLWIYCASLIVLVGAEVTRTAAQRQTADTAS